MAIGFAMELFELGILTLEDTGGLDLHFGNHESMVKLLHMMGEREGLGDILCDGVKVAAQKIGKGADYYAMHVKGLELPAYDPRGAKGHGLGYATSYTGADHNKGYAIQEIFGLPFPYPVDRFAAEGKGALTMWNQDARTAVGDCPTMCIFMLDTSVAPFLFENTADLMKGATGLQLIRRRRAAGRRARQQRRPGLQRLRRPHARKTTTCRSGSRPSLSRRVRPKGQIFSQVELDLMLDEYYDGGAWSRGRHSDAREAGGALRLGYVADRPGPMAVRRAKNAVAAERV